MPFRTVIVLSAIAATALLQGCAGAKLDPFGRPYFGSAAWPANAGICSDPHADVQPRLIRGNFAAMPIENAYNARNAKAVVTFGVAPSGAVKVLKVDSSDKWYGRHASAAVADWQVSPAQHGGVAVPAECEVTMIGSFYGYEDEPPGKANQ